MIKRQKTLRYMFYVLKFFLSLCQMSRVGTYYTFLQRDYHCQNFFTFFGILWNSDPNHWYRYCKFSIMFQQSATDGWFISNSDRNFGFNNCFSESLSPFYFGF
jgi:hypothetical protein